MLNKTASLLFVGLAILLGAQTLEAKTTTAPKTLLITEVKEGTGNAVAGTGDTLRVHYTGTLADGKKFDSSRDRKEPFEFKLGAGQVIKGWDQGFAGMKVGGQRKLVIPPDLAYGAQGAGAVIPPNATLTFDVELVEIKKKG